MPAGKHQLTDNEGTLLSLVQRLQPTTTYQIIKVYAGSPVSNFSTSKGKTYPLIARLEELGLLSKKRIAKDKRGTEELRCTEAGRRALKNWVKQIRPEHLLLEDPLRTRVQSFDLLSPAERTDWILETKRQLHTKLQDLDAYGKDVDVPFKDFVHDNAVRSLRARMDWLDMLDLYFRTSDAA